MLFCQLSCPVVNEGTQTACGLEFYWENGAVGESIPGLRVKQLCRDFSSFAPWLSGLRE